VEELGSRLVPLGWVTDLLVGGSLATGDYAPGISDLDLVALVDGPVDTTRQVVLAELHRGLDEGTGLGLKLGCVYVDRARLLDLEALHPTWSHGSLVQRILSGVARAELVRHGYAVFGRAPLDVLPAMSADDVREAARAELTGYWTWAARRPTLWLDPVIADLGADVDGPRSPHIGDRRTAHQDPRHRTGRRPGLVDRPAALQAPG
jgi:hypothetical protein